MNYNCVRNNWANVSKVEQINSYVHKLLTVYKEIQTNVYVSALYMSY